MSLAEYVGSNLSTVAIQNRSQQTKKHYRIYPSLRRVKQPKF